MTGLDPGFLVVEKVLYGASDLYGNRTAYFIGLTVSLIIDSIRIYDKSFQRLRTRTKEEKAETKIRNMIREVTQVNEDDLYVLV